MNPNHHLDASTLVSYSAGSLADAFAVIVGAHLGVCRDCRVKVRDADQVGGELLNRQVGATLSSAAREAMLARLQSSPAQHDADPVAPRNRETHDPDRLPSALRPYFGERYSSLRWRMIGPGVSQVRAQDVNGGNLMLLRTAAGRSVPMHTHGGSELTMILQGAYDDSLGHFAPGDVADLDSDTEHQPITAPGTPCICVAATDAPLQFRGWLARTLQPLFRL